MKKTLLLLLIAAFPASVLAQPKIELVAKHEVSPEPLTTEQVWSIEPEELNPHRLRWALDRKTELRGLRAIESKRGKYKVEGRAIHATTTLHIRGEGPWYQPIESFGCWNEPVTWFATREGAENAGVAALKSWKSHLESSLPLLHQLLDQLSESNAGIAMLKARYLFRAWLEKTEQEWRAEAPAKARMAEWRSYLETANRRGVCKPGSRPKEATRPSWEARMEPPAAKPIPPQLVARAPAKRIQGFYTIKVGVNIAGKTLVGQFLVDTGASVSVMSPSWLLSQGINPKLLVVPGAKPQPVTHSGGRAMATRIEVDGIEVAGLVAPINDFLLLQTDLFSPPEAKGPCCNGILGMDFLRLYAVELVPGDNSVVKIWNRRGFDLGSKMSWVEAAMTPSEGLISECVTEPVSVVGARWDTGSESFIDIHSPWESKAKAAKGPWSIHCGPVAVATGIEKAKLALADDDRGPFASRLPGFTIGVPLLSRGPVIFDLSHGRIWFSPDALNRPLPANRSGVELKYGIIREKERILRVTSLKKGTAAQKLIDAGLKPGMVLTRLNGKAASGFDSWEVEQILAGERGKLLSVEWKAGKQNRSASTFLEQ